MPETLVKPASRFGDRKETDSVTTLVKLQVVLAADDHVSKGKKGRIQVDGFRRQPLNATGRASYWFLPCAAYQ